MMQDSFDTINNLYTGEGRDKFIEIGIASPLMLSPINESSNPFFISTGMTAESIDGLIKDAMSDEIGNPHLFTPLDLPWFSHLKQSDTVDGEKEEEEVEEDGYFTLTGRQIWKRQRRSQSPTHFSVSSSHTSCASSPPPSESGSEAFDNHNQVDTEVELLTLPMASFSLPSKHGDGFMDLGSDIKDRYDSMMMPASEMTIRSHRKNVESDRGLQSIMSLNTFNLSDFISDHEHDQIVTQLPQSQVVAQQSMTYPMTNSPAMVTTALDRPVHHRNVRSMTSFNDAKFSPLSSFSSTPELDGRKNLLRDQSFNNGQYQVFDSNTLYGGRPAQDYFTNRPKMPMRIHSNPLESLSCNPSQITPLQEVPPIEPMSEDGSCFYSSSSSNEHSDGFDVKYQGEDEISPPAPYTYGTDGAYSNLWSLAKSDAFPRDVFGSPKVGHLHQMMKLDHPTSFTELYSEQKNSDGIFGLGLQGVPKRSGLRNARMTSLNTSRHSASPYQSPLLDQTPLDPDANGTRMTIGGQVITGIITKRSRGRRVPNNPDELNNLGKSGKVYTCKVPGCGKCFRRSEHLKRHVRSIHTNEKPFTCHCGKTFSRHDNLNQHARVHGNEGTASPQDSVSPPSSPVPSNLDHLEGGSRSGRSSRGRKASEIFDYYEHGDASLDNEI